MSSSKPYLKSNVDAKLKESFIKKAGAMGYTEAAFLRLLVEKVLQANPDEEELPAATEKKEGSVTVWLTPRMKQELAKRARQQSMKSSGYVRAMLTAHLGKKPHFTEPELAALESLNFELSAIGRNVNQIAKALNTSLEEADRSKLDEIEKTAKLVKDVRNQVRVLIRANLAAWGVERGTESY